jgi:hypothetical protein
MRRRKWVDCQVFQNKGAFPGLKAAAFVGAGHSRDAFAFALPSINRPNNEVPESRQEAET